jgi:hypothetical protein
MANAFIHGAVVRLGGRGRCQPDEVADLDCPGGIQPSYSNGLPKALELRGPHSEEEAVVSGCMPVDLHVSNLRCMESQETA